MEPNQKLESEPQPPRSTSSSPRIGIALSGGGFRATLFHLGVVCALRDCGLLKDVKLICSVSGGSILAAHLALHWDKYLTPEGFTEAADDVLKCIRTGLQNSIMVRWACVSSFVMPKLFGCGNPSKILQKKYDDLLYKEATFAKLQTAGPEIHILATSLTTGASCRFTRSHFEIMDGSNQPAPLESQKLSFAVASSSAFPLFFPPILVNDVIIGRDHKHFSHNHLLTDGGVFDNLAVVDLIQSARDCDLLIVSDASANFDYRTKRYSNVISISRNLRANEIIMHNLGNLNLLHHAPPNINLCRIAIEDELVRTDTNGAPLLNVQQAVRNLETHLNATPDAEIDAILRHAQALTWHALEKWKLCSQRHELWLPVDDQLSTMNKDNERSPGLWFKQLRRSLLIERMLSNWVLWSTVIIWVFLIVGSRFAYKTITREHGQPEKYVIHVKSSSGPVAEAKVDVSLENTVASPDSGYTDANGDFRFDWELMQQPPWAHFVVTKEGFQPSKETFVMTPEPQQHIVSLIPADTP